MSRLLERQGSLDSSDPGIRTFKYRPETLKNSLGGETGEAILGADPDASNQYKVESLHGPETQRVRTHFQGCGTRSVERSRQPDTETRSPRSSCQPHAQRWCGGSSHPPRKCSYSSWGRAAARQRTPPGSRKPPSRYPRGTWWTGEGAIRKTSRAGRIDSRQASVVARVGSVQGEEAPESFSGGGAGSGGGRTGCASEGLRPGVLL